MRTSTVPTGVYVPQYPVGIGSQVAATIASNVPGVRYGTQSAVSPTNVAYISLQPTGSFRDFKNRGPGVPGGLNINVGGFGVIGYLGNPYNYHPELNNPYTYLCGVSPYIQSYYRGAPGEYRLYGNGYSSCGPSGNICGPCDSYGSYVGGCGPCAGGCCSGGPYTGPNYYRR